MRANVAIPWIVSLSLHAALAAASLLTTTLPETSSVSTIELIDMPTPPEKPDPPDPPKPLQPEEPLVVDKPAQSSPPPSRRRIARPKATESPPKGTPKEPEPAAVDTGPKTFGLTLEGATTAAPGEGVSVPQGETLRESPQIRKRGKGQQDGKRKGFKTDYAPGEEVPYAVVTTMPKVLKRITADYPDRMKALGIEGKVVLQLTISAEGAVTDATVLSSLHPILDQSATRAALQMRFSPALVNATVVAVKIRYTFTFVLD